MATIEPDGATLARSIPAAYTEAVKAVGERPGWLTAAINLGAIVATFATVNFVTGMLFDRPSEPVEVAVAAESKADRAAIDGATEPAPALAALASHARSLVPRPAGETLFGKPGPIVSSFTLDAAYPPDSGFTSAPVIQPPRPPVIAEPDPATDEQPTLFAYLPEPLAGAVERVVPEPALVAIESLAAAAAPDLAPPATGAPLSLLPPLLESTDSLSEGTTIRQPLAATAGSAASVVRTTSESTRSTGGATGSVVGATATAVSTATGSVTGTVRSLLN